MKKNYHVVPHKDGWAVKAEGSKSASNVTSTQSEAIEIAKAYAKNQKSELIIHRTDGEIRKRNTYGDDPFPPRG